ncbi:DUF4190 domain-containing protein [Streptomyces sp. NPDC057702]|uniref:DUF4190 domain-containing protein n=1 Tax=unclassified Streptomyces TaxID=2593676 RepID=UPI0036BB63C8
MYPTPYGAAWGRGVHWPNNAQGTAALVLGIVGLVLFFSVVFGIILGVLAIVFGVLGRGKAQRREADNGGSALAGIILGIIACVASVVMIFVYVATDGDESDGDESDEPYGSTGTRVSILVEGPLRGI